MRRSSNPNLDGYVFLNPKERQEAENWMKSHNEELDPDDEGSYIDGTSIIYGLEEDSETGLLSMPRIEDEERTQDERRRKMAFEAKKHSERMERSLLRLSIPKERMRVLRPRERKVIELWFDGLSERHIGAIVRLTRRQVGYNIKSVLLKLQCTAINSKSA